MRSQILLKVTKLEDAISKAKKLAQEKIVRKENADEFVEIAEADGFKIYVVAAKTVDRLSREALHENPRDVFMFLLEGEVEFTFEDGKRTRVKTGECFVLRKHLKHECVFEKMTVAIEGVYEEEL
jgi:quercetin dioxygenase-like cupin family protein